MTYDQREDGTRAPIVETASATTSPDNARSGNSAYFIAILAIAVLGLVGTAISGCVSMVSGFLEEEYYGYGPTAYEQMLDERLDERDYDDFDDYINDYFDNLYDNDGTSYPNGNSNGSPVNESEGTTVKDVLDSNLAIYQSTIDQLLPVSVYANAQGPVRTFVRELVIADRDASSQIATSLKTAAWNDDNLSQALSDASQMAQEMVSTLQGMEFPKAEGDNASEISRNLEVGRGKAIDRWKAIADELDMLAASDEVDAKSLNEADELVTQAAQEAADAFAEALSASAAR